MNGGLVANDHEAQCCFIYGCDVDGVELRSESRRFSRLLALACTTVIYSKVDR